MVSLLIGILIGFSPIFAYPNKEKENRVEQKQENKEVCCEKCTKKETPFFSKPCGKVRKGAAKKVVEGP